MNLINIGANSKVPMLDSEVSEEAQARVQISTSKLEESDSEVQTRAQVSTTSKLEEVKFEVQVRILGGVIVLFTVLQLLILTARLI